MMRIHRITGIHGIIEIQGFTGNLGIQEIGIGGIREIQDIPRIHKKILRIAEWGQIGIMTGMTLEITQDRGQDSNPGPIGDLMVEVTGEVEVSIYIIYFNYYYILLNYYLIFRSIQKIQRRIRPIQFKIQK